MVSRGGGVAVFRCGTPRADTQLVGISCAGVLRTYVEATVNVGVSGLVVAQRLRELHPDATRAQANRDAIF
jgi:hypothetical protein